MVKTSYKVVNVVASVTIDEKIDLYRIARKYRDVEWNPERFPGLILRLANPKACILMFHTGKMVVTGLAKAKDINEVTEEIIKKIKNAGIEIRSKPKIKIQNVVASGEIGSDINLDLASMLLERAIYEPEVFPGLIYRMTNPKVAFLIFSSGRIVIAGAKSEDLIKKAIDLLIEQLEELELIVEN